ncbi:hypothetical protein JCM11641_002924 [Rhodosporidiobolus odoratus]
MANPRFAENVPAFDKFGDEMVTLMEAITGPPGLDLLKQSGLLSDQKEHIDVLENAAGAGILTELLKKELAKEKKVKIVMGDVEQNMVNLAKARIEQNKWENVEAKVIDAHSLPSDDAAFDYVFINFGVQLMPDPKKVVEEAHRVLRPTSTFGYTSWTSPAFISILQAVDPAAPFPPIFDTPYSSLSATPDHLTSFGFSEIQIKPVTVQVPFESPEDCADKFKKTMPPIFGDKDRSEKIKDYLRKEHGEGKFVLDWEGLVITAKKA